MKYILWIIIFLLFACIREKETPFSDRILRTVNILPVWEGMAGMPEGLRVTFYLMGSNKYIQDNLPPEGGSTMMREGEYGFIMYSNGSEKIFFKNVSKYGEIEASTNKVHRPSYVSPVPEEESFDQPDMLWMDKYESVLICGEPPVLKVYPRQIVKEHCGEIAVKGMEQVQAIRGAITGMTSRFLLSTEKSHGEPGTIFFDVSATDKGVAFTFRTFGVYNKDNSARKHYLTLEFLLPNGIAKQNIDITDQLENLIDGECLKINNEIVIPPSPTDPDGGFDADVGKWDEVIVPIPI